MTRAGSLLRMNRRGTLTIPKEVRKGLDEDTLFEVVRRADGVIELRPQVVVDASQQWFWTERWQRMEREADEDYAAGRYQSFDSPEEFLAELERVADESDADSTEPKND